ncbi:protein indeterminate-domain 9-like [Cucurbita pepo subsp. pepo]|uniref:protein indeterminate-domain 9-like n=1 Tax=Cucurbita pepo subsp. pepo TaxID=3664 RepID=UPI000C9D287D|nr:protein indeterminate-domain 9-like [Cucurbita pepo subsp. pepo]
MSEQSSQLYHLPHNPNPNPNPNPKKKRNFPGKPDPDAEVIALSPNALMATNRFICEICNKGFQRDQNLQLHRRGHNLPWKLRQRSNKEVKKKVYICPEKSCVHHDPARALGDLTGIKKHFSRKHGEKKWKCEKCSKKYAVQSDWKAHSKTCGTREYKCDCGTLFSRKDSFITHRAFCDALADESGRLISSVAANSTPNFIANSLNESLFNSQGGIFVQSHHNNFPINNTFPFPQIPPSNLFQTSNPILGLNKNSSKTAVNLSSFCSSGSVGGGKSIMPMSATALLLKAAHFGSTKSNPSFSGNSVGVMSSSSSSFDQSKGELQRIGSHGGSGSGLRDFLGTREREGNGNVELVSLLEMSKFGSSMSSEMGLSEFIGNARG